MSEEKERGGRNRTITLTPEREGEYLARCLSGEGIAAAPGDRAEADIRDKIIHGDCFAVTPRMPRGFADLMIVDPPYNLDKTYGKNTFHKMDDDAYEAFTRRWIEAALPLLKEDASVYVCCDWRSSLLIGRVLGDYFLLRNRITWQREKGRGALTNWKNAMEDIWFATLSAEYSFRAEAVKQRRKVVAPYRVDGKPKDWVETPGGNYRDTFPSNFWDDISIPYWSMPENTAHPAQKPEKLMAKIILASSQEGDWVFDPFAGVGSSCVTAKKLNRRYTGIEAEGAYCALAEKRLEIAEADASIQGYADHVFWERNTLAQQKKQIAAKSKEAF